jgi:hypothetical protein
MLSVAIKKNLPGKTTTIKSVSEPIAIPIKRDYSYNNTPNSASMSGTPPNYFMEHLQKRMAQFSTSPGFVYNARN